MSDKILVGTKLTGGIRIDLGKGKIVRPDIPVEMERADLMAIGGVEKMLKSGKLVIIEKEAPVAPVAPVEPPAPPAPVEPPKAPEPVAELEAPKQEKKSKKIRGLTTHVAHIDEASFVTEEPESRPESEEPKE